MKIDSVSNQNFNGRINFITHINKIGKEEVLDNTLKPILGDRLTEMELMISKKPYDLFISRPKNISEFYQVDANVDFENVLGSDKAKKGISSMVYENKLDRFPIAAEEAMRSFERSKEYSALTKPDGFFKTIWNMIRGIKS